MSHARLGTSASCLVTLAVFGLLMTGSATAPPPPDPGTSPASPPKRVLVIYDYARPTNAVLSHEQALTAELRSGSDLLQHRAEQSELAEGIAVALHEEHRAARARQVRGAELLRLARGVKRVAQ